jgi:[protein-PII] uridylyltransferase
VVSPDRPGTFSRVAGVLALHNLEVLGAEAHSDEGHADGDSMAVSEFVVQPRHGSGPIEWEPVIANLRRALAGDLPLEDRLAERVRHARGEPRSAAASSVPSVRFDNGASSNATFVEVRAPDMVGLLHRVTKALAECGLDIRHARVQTLGAEVIDAFYVRDSTGGKVRDGEFAAIESSVIGALAVVSR